MVRLGTVVIGVEEVDRAVVFWAAALGYEPHRFPDAPDDFTILVPPDGDGIRVALQRSHTPVREQPRVHVDLVVADGDEQVAEIERLLGLGAMRVAWTYPDDPDFVVLADPDGNRFCVVDASHG